MDEDAPALVGPGAIHWVSTVLDFLGCWVREEVSLGFRKVVVVQEEGGVVVDVVGVEKLVFVGSYQDLLDQGGEPGSGSNADLEVSSVRVSRLVPKVGDLIPRNRLQACGRAT